MNLLTGEDEIRPDSTSAVWTHKPQCFVPQTAFDKQRYGLLYLACVALMDDCCILIALPLIDQTLCRVVVIYHTG